MIIIFYLLLLFLNLFIVLKKKQSQLLLFCVGLFMIIVISGNNSSGDIANYITSYYDTSYQFSFFDGWLFYKIMRLFNAYGMDFFCFKLFCSLIIVCNYFFVLLQLKELNKHLIVFFYLIYPFYFDVEQFRNGIAFSLFLIGYIFYLRNLGSKKIEKRKGQIIFVLISIIAILFHALIIFYLLGVFGIQVLPQKIRRSMPLVISLSMIIIRAINAQFSLANIVYMIIGTSSIKISAYLENKVAWGFLLPLGLHLLVYFTIFFINEEMNREGQDIYFIEYSLKMTEILFYISFLYLNSITFYRIIRNIIIIIMISYVYLLQCELKITKKYIMANGLMVIMVMFWMTYDLFIRLDEIVIPCLTSNQWISF